MLIKLSENCVHESTCILFILTEGRTCTCMYMYAGLYFAVYLVTDCVLQLCL